jgi:ATP-dependent DNA helicase RecG
MGVLDLQKFEPFPKNPAISKVFREIGLADELGSGMRNTYKYTQLYSGQNPLFEEGNIFRTIIPLKKIATQKVGGGNVAQDVARNVARNVAQDKVALAEFIKEKVRSNDRITRKVIADEAGVSVKTIERAIKEIENLQYVGTGSNGHWELNE